MYPSVHRSTVYNSQEGHGSNLDVHQQMNRQESCGTYTQWNITQPLKKYIWISSNEVDETGAYYTEWSKSEWKTPIQYQSAQFSSVTQSCPTLCDPMNRSSQASLSITNSRSSLRLTPIKSVMPSSHLILCHPLLLLPPIPPSIRVFSNEYTNAYIWNLERW